MLEWMRLLMGGSDGAAHRGACDVSRTPHTATTYERTAVDDSYDGGTATTREDADGRASVQRRLFGERASVPTIPVLPPFSGGYPPSIQADFGDVGSGATVLAASVRGLSHQGTASCPRQDSYAFAITPTRLVIAVADGVGSAAHSDIGSAIVARTAVSVINDATRDTRIATAVRAAMQQEAAVRRCLVDDLATTLLVAIVQIGATDAPWRAKVLEWGDSRASVLTTYAVAEDGHPEWRRVTRSGPDKAGDYNTTAAFPTAIRPTGIASFNLRPGQVLLAATDGIDAQLLRTNPVGHGLATAWCETPSIYQFIADVGFDRAGARDDRTAVCLFRPHAPTAQADLVLDQDSS